MENADCCGECESALSAEANKNKAKVLSVPKPINSYLATLEGRTILNVDRPALDAVRKV